MSWTRPLSRAGFQIIAGLALAAFFLLVPLKLWQQDIPGPRPNAAQHDDGARISYPAPRFTQLTLPDGTRETVRSILNITAPMQFGDYRWDEGGVPAGPVWARVDLRTQTISVFRAGHEIGSAVVLFGASSKPTPTGIFPIITKAEQHYSTLYDAPMPFMLRLTGDGVAVHASNVRKDYATHGCIGVPMAFARLLYRQMRKGDRVVILSSPVPPPAPVHS